MDLKQILEYNKPYNENNLNALIQKIKSNDVVPYVGAGMSMLFDEVYPLWGQFLNTTFEKFCEKSSKAEFDKKNFEEKADFLSSEMASITFADQLKAIFGKVHLQRDPKDFEGTAVYVLPKIFNKGLILTTNYDKVIEKVYALDQQILTVSHPGHFEALNRSLRDNDLLLFKFHGDISEAASSIVLTKEQYERAYSNTVLIDSLKQAYLSKSMLFLGCSLCEDRPLSLLRNTCSEGISHFAIISSEEMGVKERRIALERDFFTQAIIYPDGEHECVKILLDYIAQSIHPDAHLSAIDKVFAVHKNKPQVDEWFAEQNKIQIENLGNRYCPELNVRVETTKIFNALSKNEEFVADFSTKTDELLIALNALKLESIRENTSNMTQLCETFLADVSQCFPTQELIALLSDSFKEIESEIEKINNEIWLLDKQIKESPSNDGVDHTARNELHQKRDAFGNIRYRLNDTGNIVEQYISYLNSSEVNVTNNPYVLLHGEGGMGKSHLLADVITQRNKNGQKSLLFLGQHFVENVDPLITVIKMLELNCTSEDFLYSLNEIGKNEKTKVIIFIDALNEGNGKNIWKNHLAGMLKKIEQYSWIGLVLSIRSEYLEPLYCNNSALEKSLIKIQHHGFSMVEYSAMKAFFKFYNIKYMDLPFVSQEFRNPLFLKLLCEGYRDGEINFSEITLVNIYDSYLKKINTQISENIGYYYKRNIVQQIMDQLVLYRYEHNDKNNLIPLNDALEFISKFSAEKNISCELVGELLSSGILTQSLGYENDEFLHITYERLDDYLYSQLLIQELKASGMEKFRCKHKDLIWYPDLLEMFVIVLSEETEFEIFEIFENTDLIVQSFCNALKWRKTETITDKTIAYINKTVLKESWSVELFYDNLFLLAAKHMHVFNAERTVKDMLAPSMPDRDACFIPLFDELFYQEESSLNRLLDWSLAKNEVGSFSDETIRLSTLMLSVLLISPNRVLRDKTTKGMSNLLTGKIDLLIDLLNYHEKTDDPYVVERLYAVAFACVISESDVSNIEKLALYIYEHVFNQEIVYPNMLFRDYAKSIIEYAQYKTQNAVVKNMDVTPPYRSTMPDVPSDEEIEGYRLDYTIPEFQKHWWSQNTILTSMSVEYNRVGNSGGYGDFGRYTFQSYFSNWRGLDYNDLKNIAIKKIFDMGYDVEKHGGYDNRIKGGRLRSTKVERIGKKYQWIAFYELAAQVADNFKLPVHLNDCGRQEDQYCASAAEPSLRNIDTTILVVPNESDMKKTIHHQLYHFSKQTNNDWLRTMDDLPQVSEMLKLNYQGRAFILLSGWYNWEEDKKIGVRKYQNPSKNCWGLINSYIVKEEQYEQAVAFLQNKNFMGRWLSEPHESYQLYNKEYYWSQAYAFFKNSYYGGETWKNLSDRAWSDATEIDLKVLMPTNKYLSERDADSLYMDGVCSWYKPCEELFESLGMQYGKENSVLYNSEGQIICFDSSELLSETIGFFIDEHLFMSFLEDNGYKIVWTALFEKSIVSDSHTKEFSRPTVSKVCVYNDEMVEEVSSMGFND